MKWRVSGWTKAWLGVACWVSGAGLAFAQAGSGQAPAWPKDWMAFGPVPAEPGVAAGSAPSRAALLPGAALKAIPSSLEIGGARFEARPVTLDAGNRIDFNALFGGAGRGRTAYLLAPLRVERDTTLRLGAGANWWMQWWLDGAPLFDTLAAGNGASTVAADNHVLDVPLRAGDHVLAVAVIGGSGGFRLAAGALANRPADRAADVEAAARELGVTWPREWRVFGPVRNQSVGGTAYGLPCKEDLLPGASLTKLTSELEIDGQPVKSRSLAFEDGVMDFGRIFRTRNYSQGAYLLGEVTAAADIEIQVGAGADWWMQWWLDGVPVFDTLDHGHGGNLATPVGAWDHVFPLRLAKGRHVLAVAVFGYREFKLAVAGPAELRARPEVFRDALNRGRRKYRPPHGSIAADYASARADFRKALERAGTDEERAEALLALAENGRLDVWGVGAAEAPALRADCEAVLALPGARPDQKADASLGQGAAWLLEGKTAEARVSFDRALSFSDKPDGVRQAGMARARACIQERDFAGARRELAALTNQPGYLTLLGFDARLHLAALDVMPRIRPDRPRLFFNTETWPAVKARMLADANGWAALRDRVEALPADPEVKDWGLELMQAALVYRVAPEPDRLRTIGALLRATVDDYLKLRAFNAHMETRVGCAAALDWVWNDLPAPEREALARDLLRYAYGWHVQDMQLGLGGHVAKAPYYYYDNMHWYIALATLHGGLTPAEFARAVTELGRGYEGNVVASFGRRLQIMKDRGMVTRVDYAFNDLPTPSWTFLHAWRAAVGPIPAEWVFASGIAPSCVLRNMLGFHQGTYRDFGYGNAWRRQGGWQLAHFLFYNLGQFVSFFAGYEPEEAAIADWIRARMQAVGAKGPAHYPVDPYLTDPRAESAPRLPGGLPLARHYPVNGLILLSSGFDVNDSTYVLFACGGGDPRAGSLGEHFDAGHFTIFKKGYLALDSGTRALGQSGAPGGEEYDRQSVAHNTILIRMPGETFTSPYGAPLESNSGGQRHLPAAAHVLAFETGPLFAYAAADLTGAYHSNKCSQVARQFLFLPPDHVVVCDRVAAAQADYPKTWLLHTANEPAMAGREFRADQEQGRLFCRTLLPSDAVLEPIGGPGREFWADGRNWPMPEHSPYARNIGMTNAADVPENVGRWRVEVKPGAARAADVFLHLIEVGDQAALTAMSPSTRIEEPGAAGVEFQAGARTVRVVFNTDGVVGGHIRLTQAGKVLVDRPLAAEVQRQEGLAREQ